MEKEKKKRGGQQLWVPSTANRVKPTEIISLSACVRGCVQPADSLYMQRQSKKVREGKSEAKYEGESWLPSLRVSESLHCCLCDELNSIKLSAFTITNHLNHESKALTFRPQYSTTLTFWIKQILYIFASCKHILYCMHMFSQQNNCFKKKKKEHVCTIQCTRKPRLSRGLNCCPHLWVWSCAHSQLNLRRSGLRTGTVSSYTASNIHEKQWRKNGWDQVVSDTNRNNNS